MKKIDFHRMTSSVFQTFCNALLWLEIGDTFIGYEAPGKDGGIDGKYVGNYKRQKGKWRFQYKFHLTDRKKAFQSIKTDLKNEIAKLKDENHFVLLTNVAFNPKEREEMLLKAEKLLIACSKDDVHFHLWDGGVLQRLSIKYPILEVWLDTDGTAACLLPYQKAFEKQLSTPGTALNTLTNAFISRSSELRQLNDYLDDANNFLALIKGEAGIGKTRLAIEFFKQTIDPKKGWVPLAITHYNLDLNVLKRALSGEQNYIVLVDDAQNFSATMLADLKQLGGRRGKFITKFIFTIRSIQTNEALKFISTLGQPIPMVELNKLTPEETKQLFEKELSNTYLRHFIEQLVLISRGRPILIVGILNAASQKKNIVEIKSQAGFNNYVLQYFDQFLDQFVQQTGLERLKAKRLLGITCLLEPFSYEDAQLIRRLAETEKMDEDFVDSFLKTLKTSGLSSGSHEQSIKPDYYSDVFIQEYATKNWIIQKLAQYKDFKSNILMNLASVDEIEKDSLDPLSSLLDQSLHEYFLEIKTSDCSNALTERMELAYFIAFQKPEIAINALRYFTRAMNDPTHFLEKEQARYKGASYNPNSTLIAYAKGIMHDILYYQKYHETAFQLLIELYMLTEDKTLFRDTFSFTHTVYLRQYSTTIQQFFAEKCMALLAVSEPEKATFLINCLKELLELQLSSSRWGLLKRHTVSIQTHYLPKHHLIEGIRLTVMDVLINCYCNHNHQHIRFEALSLLLDIPREISRNKCSPSSYESDVEIEKLLAFLEKEVKCLPNAFRKEVLEELYWFKKQRVHPKYHPRLDALSQLLQPQSLTQQIVHHLTNLDVEYVRSDNSAEYQDRYRKILAGNTPQSVADSLEEIWSTSMSTFWHFAELIDLLCEYDVQYAKAAYVQLKVRNLKFIYQFGGVFLRTFRCNIHLWDFYKQEADAYQSVGSEKELNTILAVYCVHSSDKILLNAYDKSLISAIFLNRTEELGFNMVYALVLYYKQAATDTIPFFKSFLEDCSPVNAAHLFRLLNDEISLDHQLAEIMLAASVRFTIDHYIEQSLIQIAKCVQPDVIFRYFLQRFEHKKNLRRNSEYGYGFVPTGERDFFSDSLPEDYRLALFNMTLQWYVHFEGDWFEKQDPEYLLSYIRPASEISQPIAHLYMEIRSREKRNCYALSRLTESLKVFHSKTSTFIYLLNLLLVEAQNSCSENGELLNDMYLVSYEALLCVGGKSGTAGQPFECDIQLRDLLLKERDSYLKNDVLSSLINSALQSLEQSIKEQCQEEEPVW